MRYPHVNKVEISCIYFNFVQKYDVSANKKEKIIFLPHLLIVILTQKKGFVLLVPFY